MLKLTKNQAKAKKHSECLKIICFLHPRYQSQIIRDILKNVQKTIASALMTFMINDHEDQTENEK